jgi:hypothetical protein
MKTAVLTGFLFMATSAAYASTIQQLFLDAGGGTTATIDVDNLGFTTCIGTLGGCSGLIIPALIIPHTTLRVFGSIGQFEITVTGVGGLSAIGPTLQNLSQIIAARTGAGSVVTRFTDSDYCLGGGGCFAPKFVVSASTVNDLGITSSTTSFSSFVSGVNGIPTTTLIGSLSGLNGLAASAANSFANPVGMTGSLTSATLIQFSGAGTVQANFQISSTTNTVPTNVPTNKDQCMNGGWTTLMRADGTGFKNQGDCIQYVNTGK